MAYTQSMTPAVVLLLADHLDAVLAAGEDIMKLDVDIEGVRKSDGVAAPWDRMAKLVGEAHLFELTLVSRVLQARNRAFEVAKVLDRDDSVLAPLIGLFVSGTSTFEDAVAELAQRTGADFDMGLDPMVYLRTRGVIPADAGTLIGVRKLQIGETFLVARRIELGPLLDLAAALLDVLDAVYGLFDEATALADVERIEREGGSAKSISSQDTDAPRQAAGS